MPILNERGDHWASGIGGTPISVDDVAVLPRGAGARAWIDADTVIAQECSDICRVVTYHVPTQRRDVLAERGVNRVVAGGGAWATFLAGHGVDFSNGVYLPRAWLEGGRAGAGKAGPDGAIPFKTVYQSGGGWEVMERSGERWTLTQAEATNVNLLGGRRSVWVDSIASVQSIGMPTPTLYGGVYSSLRVIEINGRLYCLYQMADGRLVLHPGDSPFGVVITQGLAYQPDMALTSGGNIRVVYSRTSGEADVQKREVSLTEFVTDVRPAVTIPIGPLTAPRTADDRYYDLAPFILGAPATWPRKGPTHPMHQVRTPVPGGELFHFVKFGDIMPDGSSYETWGVDNNWIYHLRDASDPRMNRFEDQRWFPRRMRIGQQHAFVTLKHWSIVEDRNTCAYLDRVPFVRRMWLHAIYDRFYCGPDLGERAVALLVYDPTDNVHIDGRGIELGFFAFGAGSFAWKSYHSSKAFTNGIASFPDSALMHPPSNFYLFGGPALQPKLASCDQRTLPSYPKWIEEQEPHVNQPCKSNDEFVNHDMPLFIAAYRTAHGDPNWVPDWAWAVLQEQRRLGLFGEHVWSVDEVVQHELRQGAPKEAP